MKVSELQAGSELPSGEEERATEITSKPSVTGLQMSTDCLLSLLFAVMNPNSLLHPSIYLEQSTVQIKTSTHVTHATHPCIHVLDIAGWYHCMAVYYTSTRPNQP